MQEPLQLRTIPNRLPGLSGEAHAPLKVVAIGGGTGLSALLRGLKYFVVPSEGQAAQAGTLAISELTAVVTVTDDGGSSGRLRQEFQILPPGDIRNCIVALSEDEALLSRLLQYRFPAESALEGHNFGNLFLAALTAITSDFAEAVQHTAEILKIRGRIFPSTTANVNLEARMDDGSIVQGETRITASKHRIRQISMIPADAEPLPETLRAIAEADLITMGPGSLFTSLVPNLLVRGIPQAIAESPALKCFVCNLMTQANESLGLTASDHIRALDAHGGRQMFDVALVNRAPLSDALKGKYALEGASHIVADTEEIEALGVRAVLGEFLEQAAVARHASQAVAQAALELALQWKGHRESAEAMGWTGR